MSALPYSAGKNRTRSDAVVTDYLRAYFVARMMGVSVRQLVGAPTCKTTCALEREAWERVTTDEGHYYRCSRCKRFIGWIREEK